MRYLDVWYVEGVRENVVAQQVRVIFKIDSLLLKFLSR